MDFLKSNKHESTQDFINQNLELGMLPMVTRPTRITKTSATLIDNIIVSMNYIGRYSCNVLIDNTSDLKGNYCGFWLVYREYVEGS